MAGIKRRQTEDDSKLAESGKSKKLKSSEPTKAEAKFALKVARGKSKSEPKPEGTPSANGKEKVLKKEKKQKLESKKSAKTLAERPKAARNSSDITQESDTTEEENGYHGFSANGDVDSVGSPSGSEADAELSSEIPAKKQKKEHKLEAKPKKAGTAHDNVRKDADNGGNLLHDMFTP
jgi:hypothetical protein